MAGRVGAALPIDEAFPGAAGDDRGEGGAARCRLRVAYDGTQYSGWMRLAGRPLAVAGLLDRALSLAVGCDVSVQGASRTDAGVHARGQAAHFDLPGEVASARPPDWQRRWEAAANRMLPGDIRVRALGEAPRPDFHATFSAARPAPGPAGVQRKPTPTEASRAVPRGGSRGRLCSPAALVEAGVPQAPLASALCVRGGRIEAVGSERLVGASECAAAAGAGRTVDLLGATVVPGLTDSHAHLNMEAARRTRADLRQARSAPEAARAAADFAARRPDLVNASGGWVLGFGWDQTAWPGGAFPTRAALDELFPDTPVFLEQLSGHAAWLNGRALAAMSAHIPASGDPPGGHVERDGHGRPTGVLTDRAKDAVERQLPQLPEAAARQVMDELLRDLAAHGLTGVHDMDSHGEDVDALLQRHSRGELSLRVYAARDSTTSSPTDPMVATDDGLLTVRTVKFFGDGAMGSWSAAMLQPYDDRNSTGTLVYEREAFKRNVSAWAARGYQVATHAIGDAANRQVLDVYEELLAGRPADEARWRVEHAQILAAEDLPRFARLGVIASMQPSHCASDLPYAVQRLGFQRASRSYAWSSLLRTGVPALPFGSDFPTAGSVPPLLGLHAAVTRETPGGVPAGGWFPEQRVTREQALRGYTTDAAYASLGRSLGALRPGFYADLTLFDRDVMTVDPPQLLRLTVWGTLVGGRAVHAAATAPPGLRRLAQEEGERRRAARAAAAGPAGTGPPSRARASARLSSWWWPKYVEEVNEDRHHAAAPAAGALLV
ncbi:unnamed protein product [Prorocentrum cordatum]|uniref:Amidohydrolase 3 domain-containing protein n=1 Tax=Prorocentrum cordatum TaxID=2364126 RepID=A0ABN9UEB4_9DINO|nr:unnamed protein product [Polarella glacialis]